MVHRVGATSTGSWGSAVMGLTAQQLHGLRVSAACSMGRLPRGASVGLRLHSYSGGVRLDPMVLHT
eukprot:2295664-Pyramimonas_sp.AAC.1